MKEEETCSGFTAVIFQKIDFSVTRKDTLCYISGRDVLSFIFSDVI